MARIKDFWGIGFVTKVNEVYEVNGVGLGENASR
jgi:hypothetical protein